MQSVCAEVSLERCCSKHDSWPSCWAICSGDHVQWADSRAYARIQCHIDEQNLPYETVYEIVLSWCAFQLDRIICIGKSVCVREAIDIYNCSSIWNTYHSFSNAWHDTSWMASTSTHPSPSHSSAGTKRLQQYLLMQNGKYQLSWSKVPRCTVNSLQRSTEIKMGKISFAVCMRKTEGSKGLRRWVWGSRRGIHACYI
jgi:hypothetical protein